MPRYSLLIISVRLIVYSTRSTIIFPVGLGNIIDFKYLNLFQAMCGSKTVGAIVCKLDLHKKMVRRGYIAMLAVDKNYRRRGIGKFV